MHDTATIIQDSASTSPELQSISARLALLEMQTNRDFAYRVEVEAVCDRLDALEASAPTDADRQATRKSALYLSVGVTALISAWLWSLYTGDARLNGMQEKLDWVGQSMVEQRQNYPVYRPPVAPSPQAPQ
jgi:hypothetical protein